MLKTVFPFITCSRSWRRWVKKKIRFHIPCPQLAEFLHHNVNVSVLPKEGNSVSHCQTMGEQLYASIPQAVILTRLFSMEENWPFCNCGFRIGAILTFYFLLLNLFESAEPKFFTKFLLQERQFWFQQHVPKKTFAT